MIYIVVTDGWDDDDVYIVSINADTGKINWTRTIW
jgi:hypothetical protein